MEVIVFSDPTTHSIRMWVVSPLRQLPKFRQTRFLFLSFVFFFFLIWFLSFWSRVLSPRFSALLVVCLNLLRHGKGFKCFQKLKRFSRVTSFTVERVLKGFGSFHGFKVFRIHGLGWMGVPSHHTRQRAKVRVGAPCARVMGLHGRPSSAGATPCPQHFTV